MKSVLISIQPYWVFLIIAKAMGWNTNEEKTIEVRKNHPKDKCWDKVAKIYCSKDKKSFAKIPKEYQPFMEKYLGKVIGEFVCDEITEFYPTLDLKELNFRHFQMVDNSQVNMRDLYNYANGKYLYGWHISDLVIYDKPKELSHFLQYCEYDYDIDKCIGCKKTSYNDLGQECCDRRITRPPQSWCYVEGGGSDA